VASTQRHPASNGESRKRDVLHAPGPPASESSHASSQDRALDRLVDEAVGRITRFEASEAFSASAAQGVIIDIRSQDARELHGVIPRSLHIPRTVLEWRIAVDSPWRNVHLGGLDQQLILICDHGYSSILAASNLVQLGFYRAGDVVGGFEAWRNAALPIAPYRHRLSVAGDLPGLGPPEQAQQSWTACEKRSRA
jgi:rhodanese-related sulfurtransferase